MHSVFVLSSSKDKNGTNCSKYYFLSLNFSSQIKHLLVPRKMFIHLLQCDKFIYKQYFFCISAILRKYMKIQNLGYGTFFRSVTWLVCPSSSFPPEQQPTAFSWQPTLNIQVRSLCLDSAQHPPDFSQSREGISQI